MFFKFSFITFVGMRLYSIHSLGLQEEKQTFLSTFFFRAFWKRKHWNDYSFKLNLRTQKRCSSHQRVIHCSLFTFRHAFYQIRFSVLISFHIYHVLRFSHALPCFDHFFQFALPNVCHFHDCDCDCDCIPCVESFSRFSTTIQTTSPD